MAENTDETRSQKFGKVGAEYRQKLVESMASQYGGKASEAVPLSPDEEVTQYRKPTSPPALAVLQQGGSLAEAERANAMWGQQLKQEQATMKQHLNQSGATADQMLQALTQAGLTDDLILKQTRGMAWELAKANGKNDIAEETKYHERMVPKVQAQRDAEQVTYQTVDPAQPTAPAGPRAMPGGSYR